MGKLRDAYSSTQWSKINKTVPMATASRSKEELTIRWKELKKKYPWQEIRKEWDAFKKWWEKKNGKELIFNTSTIVWFETTWLKKKPVPPAKLLSLTEVEEGKIQFAERQKQACIKLLSDFGMEVSPEIKELLNQACGGNEGLTKYTVKDWLNSDGNRPHPKSHPITNQLYQLILTHKTK